MLQLDKIRPDNMNRIIDFGVLALTYYFSCLLLSVGNGIGLLLQALVYAAIVFACVGLCRVLVARSGVRASGVTRQIVGNATGILAATLVMLLIGKLTAGDGKLIVALLFSSVMAFFVLGTLSSLGHKNTSAI